MQKRNSAASIICISPLFYLMSLRLHRSGKFYIGFNVIDDDGVDGRNLVFNTKRAFAGTVSASRGKCAREGTTIVVGKSASIHSTQARFIQRNDIEYPLYRSPRLSAASIPFFGGSAEFPRYFLKRPLPR